MSLNQSSSEEKNPCEGGREWAWWEMRRVALEVLGKEWEGEMEGRRGGGSKNSVLGPMECLWRSRQLYFFCWCIISLLNCLLATVCVCKWIERTQTVCEEIRFSELQNWCRRNQCLPSLFICMTPTHVWTRRYIMGSTKFCFPTCCKHITFSSETQPTQNAGPYR